jgi:hypothetical protein
MQKAVDVRASYARTRAAFVCLAGVGYNGCVSLLFCAFGRLVAVADFGGRAEEILFYGDRK